MSVAETLLAYDIPLRFEPALVQFVKTGKLTGVELKCRVRQLSNYKACIERLSKEFKIGHDLDGLRFTHAYHPDYGRAAEVIGPDGAAEAHRDPPAA